MFLLRRIAITAAMAVVLAFAAIGVARTTGPGSPATPSSTSPAGAVADPDPAGIDALLAADQTTAAPERAATHGELRRLAAWRKLVHATVVVDLPALGGLTTIQLDHGTVSAVDASSMTIAETGGGSVTVALGSETRVRRAGAKSAVADLKSGDEVFAMSRVTTAGTEAYLVVVPKG